MIELPDDAAPNRARATLVDFGFFQEGAGGAELTRIERPGNRWEVELTFPVLRADAARVLVARLTSAKSDGLRVKYPLGQLSQGNPGAAQVDGADSAGRTLKLKNLTVGYAIKEGYWLTHISAAGLRRLHHAATGAVLAGADGKAVLTVNPPLRAFPGNNDLVLLGAPELEGLVTSVVSWAIDPGGIYSGISCTLREAA